MIAFSSSKLKMGEPAFEAKKRGLAGGMASRSMTVETDRSPCG
jgi:hypothetical protein